MKVNLSFLAAIAMVSFGANGAIIDPKSQVKCTNAAIKECILTVYQGYSLCDSGDLACQCNSANDVASVCYENCPPSKSISYIKAFVADQCNLVHSLGIDASNPVEVSQSRPQDGAIPFPFPLENSFFWDKTDNDDEYDGEDGDENKIIKPDVESEIETGKNDNKGHGKNHYSNHEDKEFIKKFEREAVNYFDSPERYQNTNKQANAAFFFSKLLRKKVTTVTLTTTVTDIRVSSAEPKTIYKTITLSEHNIPSSKFEKKTYFSEFNRFTKEPEKTYASFYDDQFEKPEESEDLEEPWNYRSTQKTSWPKNDNVFSTHSYRKSAPISDIRLVSESFTVLPTEIYSPTKPPIEAEPIDEDPFITYASEYPETTSQKTKYNDYYEDVNDDFDYGEIESISTYSNTKKSHKSKYHFDSKAAITTQDLEDVDDDYYEATATNPASISEDFDDFRENYKTTGTITASKDEEYKSVYSHHKPESTTESKKKEKDDDYDEDEEDKYYHSVFSHSYSDASKPSDASVSTALYSFDASSPSDQLAGTEKEEKKKSFKKLFDKIKKHKKGHKSQTDSFDDSEIPEKQPIDALSVQRMGIYEKVASSAPKAAIWAPLMGLFSLFIFFDTSSSVFLWGTYLYIAYVNFSMVYFTYFTNNIPV